MAVARSEPFSQQVCQLGACDGSGWILGPEDVARPCECRATRLKRTQTRGIASVLPRRYRGVSFDRPPISNMAHDPGTRNVVHKVREYTDELEEKLALGEGMWLIGNTGTGKTTLGMLIAQTAITAGKSVAVYFAPKLLTQIRQTYQATESEDAYDAFFKRLTSVDLLYIDDLGSERHTDWVVEQLYALVNERYETERSVIITSNADADLDKKEEAVGGKKAKEKVDPIVQGLDRLREQIGVRTVSRLIQICSDPIPLFGPDQRERSTLRMPDA